METTRLDVTTEEHANQTEKAGIQKAYAYHRPSDESLKKITLLRLMFSEIDSVIKELSPHSRERSIAITELETACMWAIKAVVFNDSESTVEEKI